MTQQVDQLESSPRIGIHQIMLLPDCLTPISRHKVTEHLEPHDLIPAIVAKSKTFLLFEVSSQLARCYGHEVMSKIIRMTLLANAVDQQGHEVTY